MAVWLKKDERKPTGESARGRDICGVRLCRKDSLRAAGLLGLSPRTYRRACRPPNGLERIFDDLGPLYGGHILADSMLVPLIPGGAAIRAIRSPSDVIGSNPKSPRRPRTVVGQPCGLSGPYGEFSTISNATLLGQEENRRRNGTQGRAPSNSL